MYLSVANILNHVILLQTCIYLLNIVLYCMYLLNIVLYLFKANNNDTSTGSIHVVFVEFLLALVTLSRIFCTSISCFFFHNFECVYFYYIKMPKATIMKFLCQYIVLAWCVRSLVYSYFFNT